MNAIDSICLFLFIIAIIGFFLPGSYWLLSVGVFTLLIFICLFRFTWRIATAADNIITKYQDENYSKQPVNPSNNEHSEDTREEMK